MSKEIMDVTTMKELNVVFGTKEEIPQICKCCKKRKRKREESIQPIPVQKDPVNSGSPLHSTEEGEVNPGENMVLFENNPRILPQRSPGFSLGDAVFMEKDPLPTEKENIFLEENLLSLRKKLKIEENPSPTKEEALPSVKIKVPIDSLDVMKQGKKPAPTEHVTHSEHQVVDDRVEIETEEYHENQEEELFSRIRRKSTGDSALQEDDKVNGPFASLQIEEIVPITTLKNRTNNNVRVIGRTIFIDYWFLLQNVDGIKHSILLDVDGIEHFPKNGVVQVFGTLFIKRFPKYLNVGFPCTWNSGDNSSQLVLKVRFFRDMGCFDITLYLKILSLLKPYSPTFVKKGSGGVAAEEKTALTEKSTDLMREENLLLPEQNLAAIEEDRQLVKEDIAHSGENLAPIKERLLADLVVADDPLTHPGNTLTEKSTDLMREENLLLPEQNVAAIEEGRQLVKEDIAHSGENLAPIKESLVADLVVADDPLTHPGNTLATENEYAKYLVFDEQDLIAAEEDLIPYQTPSQNEKEVQIPVVVFDTIPHESLKGVIVNGPHVPMRIEEIITMRAIQNWTNYNVKVVGRVISKGNHCLLQSVEMKDNYILLDIRKIHSIPHEQVVEAFGTLNLGSICKYPPYLFLKVRFFRSFNNVDFAKYFEALSLLEPYIPAFVRGKRDPH